MNPVEDDSPNFCRLKTPSKAWLKVPLSAWILIALTAVLCLVLSYYRLLWYDELLVVWSDSSPALSRLIHFQRTQPISLDPIAYHLLAHCGIRFLGQSAFAVRLPSIVGFLVMQLCIFLFVSRMANRSAALIAMTYPVVTSVFYFSVEARPYGMMLGLTGICMVAWQSAIRSHGNRVLPLITLTLAIALTLNTHYYGVLLLVPLCGAEAFRCLLRRRIDMPVLASIAAGACGVVFTLPFLKGARAFGIHPFVPRITSDLLFDAYLKILPFLDPRHIRAFLLVCGAILLALWALAKRARKSSPAPELFFLVLLAAFPVFGYLFGVFVVHAFLYRYVIEGVIGLSALFAIPLGFLFDRQRYSPLLCGCLVVVLTVFGSAYILRQKKKQMATLTRLSVTPQLKASLLNGSDGRIYYQDIQEFALANYYEKDSELKSRMILLYSAEQEIRWKGRDTDSLTAIHLKNLQPEIPSRIFEEIAFRPEPHVIIAFPGDSNADWTAQALAEHHAIVTTMFPALGGIAESVHAASQ